MRIGATDVKKITAKQKKDTQIAEIEEFFGLTFSESVVQMGFVVDKRVEKKYNKKRADIAMDLRNLYGLRKKARDELLTEDVNLFHEMQKEVQQLESQIAAGQVNVDELDQQAAVETFEVEDDENGEPKEHGTQKDRREHVQTEERNLQRGPDQVPVQNLPPETNIAEQERERRANLQRARQRISELIGEPVIIEDEPEEGQKDAEGHPPATEGTPKGTSEETQPSSIESTQTYRRLVPPSGTTTETSKDEEHEQAADLPVVVDEIKKEDEDEEDCFVVSHLTVHEKRVNLRRDRELCPDCKFTQRCPDYVLKSLDTSAEAIEEYNKAVMACPECISEVKCPQHLVEEWAIELTGAKAVEEFSNTLEDEMVSCVGCQKSKFKMCKAHRSIAGMVEAKENSLKAEQAIAAAAAIVKVERADPIIVEPKVSSTPVGTNDSEAWRLCKDLSQHALRDEKVQSSDKDELDSDADVDVTGAEKTTKGKVICRSSNYGPVLFHASSDDDDDSVDDHVPLWTALVPLDSDTSYTSSFDLEAQVEALEHLDLSDEDEPDLEQSEEVAELNKASSSSLPSASCDEVSEHDNDILVKDTQPEAAGKGGSDLHAHVIPETQVPNTERAAETVSRGRGRPKKRSVTLPTSRQLALAEKKSRGEDGFMIPDDIKGIGI